MKKEIKKILLNSSVAGIISFIIANMIMFVFPDFTFDFVLTTTIGTMVGISIGLIISANND